MGIIKTAMMAGAGMYAVNKLAKGYESHQGARPVQQQQQQQMQPQRQSREYPPNSSQRANGGGDYSNNRNPSAQPFDPTQQQRSIDPSASSPPEYWYLDNNNDWARVPSEYANMPTTNPDYQHQAPQHPTRQQQLDFEYPQQQQQGYVIEEVSQPRSRSILAPEQIQQGLGFLMNTSSKREKKGKDGDKLSEVMNMFSK